MRDPKNLFKDRTAAKRAAAMDADLTLELSDQQRDALIAYVEKNNRYPSAIELNFKATIDDATSFPVTVLVGAMA